MIDFNISKVSASVTYHSAHFYPDGANVCSLENSQLINWNEASGSFAEVGTNQCWVAEML